MAFLSSRAIPQQSRTARERVRKVETNMSDHPRNLKGLDPYTRAAIEQGISRGSLLSGTAAGAAAIGNRLVFFNR
jgi:hypothetical protein